MGVGVGVRVSSSDSQCKKDVSFSHSMGQSEGVGGSSGFKMTGATRATSRLC